MTTSTLIWSLHGVSYEHADQLNKNTLCTQKHKQMDGYYQNIYRHEIFISNLLYKIKNVGVVTYLTLFSEKYKLFFMSGNIPPMQKDSRLYTKQIILNNRDKQI